MINRKIFFIFFIFCLINIGIAKPIKKESSSINLIKLPQVESGTIGGGIRFFYINHDLPVITIELSFSFGKLYEDKSNAGISELIVKTLSLCGSKKYPGQLLHETIEGIGGTFNVSSTWEETIISIQVLSKFADTAFDILKDITQNPNFNEQSLEKAKSFMVESIRRSKDKPDEIAFLKIREIIFDSAGYGATPTEESIKSITLKNVQDTWTTHLVSGNSVIGCISSIGFDKISGHVKDSFDHIAKGPRMDYKVPSSIPSSIKENPGRYT